MGKRNTLSNKIRIILNKMDINSISDPIKVPGGFLILKINDIREVENKRY